MSSEGAVFNAGIRWSFLIPDLEPSPGATGVVERIDAKRVRQRSTLSGLGAVLFASGVVLLFIALYKDASHTAWSPLPIVALCVLAAAVACWIAAARWEGQPNSALRPRMTTWFETAGNHRPAPQGVQAAGLQRDVMARKTSKPTGWHRPLAYPLTLRDGTEIATLRQAAALMMGLPETRKSRPVWQRAAELLMQAQKGGKAADIRAATDQICRALQLEGWI
jgi:hypothetical protein